MLIQITHELQLKVKRPTDKHELKSIIVEQLVVKDLFADSYVEVIAHEEFITDKFNLGKNVLQVRPLNWLEIDIFKHFEQMAQNLKWTTGQWSLFKQNVLKEKAQVAYTALLISDFSDVLICELLICEI